jgi:hypothetical protein
MYFNNLVCYLYFDAPPYQLYTFLWCVVKRCVSVFMFTNAPPRKVTRYGAPVNLQVHRRWCESSASNAPRIFFFLHLKFHSILNFNQ